MDPEQRRRTPRFVFDAPSEILLNGSAGAKRNARVKELSLNGCYVETEEVLNSGDDVTIKIFGKSDFFECHAIILYTNSVGAGLGFRDIRPHFLSVLRKWLLTAMLHKAPAEQIGVKS
jgi:hypothetical protein